MMAEQSEESSTCGGLRLQAETWLRMTRREVASMPIKNVQRLVHELQVHQIELVMQNEELLQTQTELKTARDRYADLYDRAPIGHLTLDPQGTILEANLPACRLFGIDRNGLLGQPAIRFVAAKDQAPVLGHLRRLFQTGIRQVCEGHLAQPGDVTVRFESMVLPHSVARTVLLDITERLRAATQAQEQQRERRRNLEARERLGHDLHDGILQSLYAIGLSLETCKHYPATAPDQVGAIVARSIGELNSVMRDMRGFVEELEAEAAPRTEGVPLGLSISLRAMVGVLARLHGRQIGLAINRAAAIRLSPAQNMDLLNLVKEALSNSFRHAKATSVRVSLRQVKTGIRLAVRDNGMGFRQPAKAGQGQGLNSMAARARRLGGILSVQSRPKKGTRVVLDLPTQYNRQAGTLVP